MLKETTKGNREILSIVCNFYTISWCYASEWALAVDLELFYNYFCVFGILSQLPVTAVTTEVVTF